MAWGSLGEFKGPKVADQLLDQHHSIKACDWVTA